MSTATLEHLETRTETECRLRYRLARGHSGSVWEAENADGDLVAVKFVVCEDGLTASTLLWSLQALSSLAHPHLIHIEDVIAEDGYIVIVMELADASLRDLLGQSVGRRRDSLPGSQVRAYLTEAAEAIDFLNGRLPTRDGQRLAIQHGGVRPSNLLLFGDAVKLADCGPVWPTGVPLKLRQSGASLEYAAPEIFRGRVTDWSDQYALAVTYCQLRGGRLPFIDTPSRLERSYLRPEPDLSMLPEAERPILKRALAPLGQDRWPSCGEMMKRLSAISL